MSEAVTIRWLRWCQKHYRDSYRFQKERNAMTAEEYERQLRREAGLDRSLTDQLMNRI